MPSTRRSSERLPDLAAEAVDDDQAVAVLAHQQLVVRLLDAGLPDHRAGLDALVFGARQLRLAHLADVAEEVRRHVAAGILAGRHFLVDDAGQLQLPRANAITCSNVAFSISTIGR